MTNSESSSFTVPQHPLPDEIQKMKRDETVCKFCGVSYLIHNEVKALQEKLAEAEKQMEYYKGSVEREKVLKEKMEKMKAELLEQSQKLKDQDQQLELFKSDLKMKAKLIHEMYTQKCQYESSTQEEQSRSEQLSAQISHLSSALKHYNALVCQQKESLQNIRKDVLQQRMLSKEIALSFGNEVRRANDRLTKEVIQERYDTDVKMKKTNEQLLKFQNEINNLREADSKLHDLKTKYIEVQNKLNVYQKHVTQLEDENSTLREKNTAIENGLIQKSKEEKELKGSLEILKREKQHEHSKHDEELTKKDEELKKLNTLCKSLEKLMNEKSAAEKEVREKVIDKDDQLKNLAETVSQMRVESGKLKMEREQTIISHHNRIEQLRESYVKKLDASEKTCTMLQNELDEMKQKLEGLQSSLKEDFEKEMKVLRTKHSVEVDDLENEIKYLKNKMQHDTSAFYNLKEEINQLKNTLSTNKTQNAQELQKCQNEILSLKRSLEASEHKTKKEHENYQKTKYEAIQKSLQDSKTHIKLMEQRLMAKNSEMTILQDTVRRECEERLELTQALSDARMQLLSIQQNPEVLGQFSGDKRLNRRTVKNSNLKTSVNPVMTSASCDLTSLETSMASSVIASNARRIKSTGSERPTRESVDSFRERIAAALGRESRFSHTR